MMLQIDWDNPILKEDEIKGIRTFDLDSFYTSGDSLSKTNIFFVLLASYHHYSDMGKNDCAAHLCFLMAYYLFIALTPPGSQQLAKQYIQQAVLLYPTDEYRRWQDLIEKGN